MTEDKTNVIHYEWRNKRTHIVMDGREFKFKSLIEYRWAQYLQRLLEVGAITFWDYETTVFEFNERYRKRQQYTPDFVVHEKHQRLKEKSYHEIKTSLRQTDIRRFRLMHQDFPKENMVLVLPYCSKSFNQSRLRGNALKYVNRIVYANPLFRKFGIK